MNEQPDTSTRQEPAGGIAADTEQAAAKGLLAGTAAGVVIPAATAATIGASMGTDAGLGVAYWWFWATPDEVPVLSALRGLTMFGAFIFAGTEERKTPRGIFFWSAAAVTCAPWLAAQLARVILHVATGLANELVALL